MRAIFIGFPGWWIGELLGLIPGPLRVLFRERPRWTIVDLSSTGVRVLKRVGAKQSEIGRFEGAVTAPAAKSAVTKLLRRAGSGEATAVLRIGESRALRKRIDLPLAAEENLKEVISFEMDRQTPFKSSEVYFAERIVSRDGESQRLGVDLTVIPRARVDDAVRLVGSWGFTPDAVEVGGSGDQPPGTMNMLPAKERKAGFSLAALANVLLLIGAVSIGGMILESAFDRQQTALAAMLVRVATAKESAEAVLELRKRLEVISSEGRFLRDLKARTPVMTELIDELSRILLDNTWIYQLRIRRNEVQLWGYSEAASNTISLLEGSENFRDVAFRSPVTQDRRLGLERFNLAAKIAGPPGGGDAQ